MGGEHRAVKRIKKSLCSTKEVAAEIGIVESLVHENIIRLLDTFQDDRYIFLVMELGRGGELFERILEAEKFSERQSRHCIRQILRGIQYCHQQRVCVRCPKPEDVVCMTNAPTEEVTLKLIDFGLAKRIHPGRYFSTI